MNTTRMSTSCYICGQIVSSDEMTGLSYALNNHWNSGCVRDAKLKDILGEKKLEPNAQEFFRKGFDYTEWLDRVKSFKEKAKTNNLNLTFLDNGK